MSGTKRSLGSERIASRSRGSETLLGRTWQSTIRLRASFMNSASRVRGMASIVEMFRSRLVGLYGSWRATPRMRGGAPRQGCEMAGHARDGHQSGVLGAAPRHRVERAAAATSSCSAWRRKYCRARRDPIGFFRRFFVGAGPPFGGAPFAPAARGERCRRRPIEPAERCASLRPVWHFCASRRCARVAGAGSDGDTASGSGPGVAGTVVGQRFSGWTLCGAMPAAPVWPKPDPSAPTSTVKRSATSGPRDPVRRWLHDCSGGVFRLRHDGCSALGHDHRLPAQAMTTDATQAISGSSATASGAPNADEHHGVTFRQVLSDLNPLQYLPVVGTIYRGVTGDVIPETLRFFGWLLVSGLLGGPMGVALSLATTAAEKITGIDPEKIVAAQFHSAPAPLMASAIKVPTTSPAPTTAPAPSDSAAFPMTQAQLAAYGVSVDASGGLRLGDVKGADVLNAIELSRHAKA